jgi:hypothetical protein
VVDVPKVDSAVKAEHRPFYGDNVCMLSLFGIYHFLTHTFHKGPDKNETSVEGFEEAFKNLGRFVFDVGCQLAAACQPFGQYMHSGIAGKGPITRISVSKYLTDASLSLPQLISTSQTTKARLLHYFPPSDNSPVAEDEPIDSWCGFHKDNSLLTGLCSVSTYLSTPTS